jgi:hypothetical protein
VQGPVYPNASTDHSKERPFDCRAGCLFDIQKDPGEHHDLAQEQASKLGQMTELWHQRQATSFQARDQSLGPPFARFLSTFVGAFWSSELTFVVESNAGTEAEAESRAVRGIYRGARGIHGAVPAPVKNNSSNYETMYRPLLLHLKYSPIWIMIWIVFKSIVYGL